MAGSALKDREIASKFFSHVWGVFLISVNQYIDLGNCSWILNSQICLYLFCNLETETFNQTFQ